MIDSIRSTCNTETIYCYNKNQGIDINNNTMTENVNALEHSGVDYCMHKPVYRNRVFPTAPLSSKRALQISRTSKTKKRYNHAYIPVLFIPSIKRTEKYA